MLKVERIYEDAFTHFFVPGNVFARVPKNVAVKYIAVNEKELKGSFINHPVCLRSHYEHCFKAFGQQEP